jgi:hypothetical protein
MPQLSTILKEEFDSDDNDDSDFDFYNSGARVFKKLSSGATHSILREGRLEL